jgi:hypothetical protein
VVRNKNRVLSYFKIGICGLVASVENDRDSRLEDVGYSFQFADSVVVYRR